jgi:flagellar biogenesis protein FliO
MDFALQLLRLAGSLILVLAIFYAVIYGLKKWGHLVKGSTTHPAMEVLSKQSFGPRHHLLLVKVPGGRNMLVGISPQNMSLMPAAPDSTEAGVPAKAGENP